MPIQLQGVKLADIQQLPATPGSLYANTTKKTYIREIILHNTNTAAETVRLYNVPDAAGALGTPGIANRFLNISITANDTVHQWFEYPIILSDVNDAIFGETTTVAKVNVMLLGDREV